MKVIPFKSIEQAETESVITVLERLLASAKAGNIKHVVIGIVRPDGELTSTWSDGNFAQMMGAAGYLFHHIGEAIEEYDSDEL